MRTDAPGELARHAPVLHVDEPGTPAYRIDVTEAAQAVLLYGGVMMDAGVRSHRQPAALCRGLESHTVRARSTA
jgi:hypothetical protein